MTSHAILAFINIKKDDESLKLFIHKLSFESCKVAAARYSGELILTFLLTIKQ